ncbi:PP2C family protein-serine/threonine phosphatase [Streptomyces sp. V2I9]|uniref:PP2C family protein-serine/threonine phosphatase n=1 Tax=Streptomyces sp. V2I9 TaxID=3042304 RepID=UPI0027D827B0|nr:GAF domain-containing SpoIIE family protein phosphatase [Streptomyces sp. V2I9]
MLIADARGAVVRCNDAAEPLLPAAAPGTPLADVAPDWLRDAHAELCSLGPHAAPATGRSAAGDIDGRHFEAHPTVRDDGSVAWWLVDDTDLQLVRTALRRERERSAFLAKASTVLLSSLNLERCMDAAARMAAESLADAALVIAPARGRRLPVVTCVRGGEPETTTVTVVPDSVPGLGEALRGFPPVPSRWIDPGAAPAWMVPESMGPVGSIVITPLPGHGVPAGALILLRKAEGSVFSEEEEIFARLFAARAGAGMSAARLYAEQSSISDLLMRELLPPPLHRISGVDFAGGYRPSADHERIGGDFYDVHPAADEGDASLVLLGDVCGKGLEAAVLTGRIRNTLHALLPLADDHQRMLGLLNTSMLSSHHTRFATMVLASAVRRGSSVELKLTSGGHPSPLIVRTDGTVEVAATQGTLIGAIPTIACTTVTASLAPGESCVLYTDGITEAKGGPMGDELFGEERLRRALAGCAGMPAEGVVEHVQMLAGQWLGGRPHDDMAVVVISAPRTHHLSAVNGHTRGRFTA